MTDDQKRIKKAFTKARRAVYAAADAAAELDAEMRSSDEVPTTLWRLSKLARGLASATYSLVLEIESQLGAWLENSPGVSGDK